MSTPMLAVTSSGGNEFIINGDSIHNTWKTAWPKAIARAWNIEYQLEHKYDINSGMEDLRTTIDKSLDKLAALLVNKHQTLNDEALESIIKLHLTDTSKFSEITKTNVPTDMEKENDHFQKMMTKLLDNSDIPDMNTFYVNILNNFQFKVKPDLTKNNTYEEIDGNDFLWYKKLLCHKSEMVLDALKEEGFIVDAMENPPIDFDRNCSTRLIVRKHNQSYEVKAKREQPKFSYVKQNQQTLRVSVSYTPLDPEIPERRSNDQEDPLSSHTFTGMGHTFKGEGRKFKGSQKNGWSDAKGLGHVLVITLPERPQKPEEFGLAVIDYEAAGKVYSFTCCT
jgi:hypothetical protein